MTLSQVAGEDDIVAKLKEIPGVDVMEGEYVSDSYIPVVDPVTKLFKPYILVTFDPPNETFDNGIADPAWDTQRGQIAVFVVSPDDRLTRVLRDQVRQKLLISFRPTDASFLRGKGGYRFVDPDLGFHRYVQVLYFRYTFNLTPDTVI